ncbi:MAG: alpha/beta fold hydrolase [Gammaproteobacteria bacterium]|nr:alpha/beta fold hydrolase [Gammaproteobacteria bacterium]
MVQFPGPCGSLEGEILPAPTAQGRFAVLCHPHPQYGGNMTDAVLDICAEVLIHHGVSVMKFNFRGVGASEGRHSQAHAETEDVVAAVAWLRKTNTVESLMLAGYSFGANMVWRALDDVLPIERVLLIAPPIGHMEFTPREFPYAIDVFAGDADDFVDQTALAAWTGIRNHIIAGADHFFSSHWDALQLSIEESLNREARVK